MESPQKGGVSQKVSENDRVLALGEAKGPAGLETGLAGRAQRDDGHFVVDREHSADEKAVYNDHYDVLLGKDGVGQWVDATDPVFQVVDVGEGRCTAL